MPMLSTLYIDREKLKRFSTCESRPSNATQHYKKDFLMDEEYF